MKDNSKWPELVKNLREMLLLTQIDFAKVLDVAYVSVNRWENGLHEPTIKAKRKIVELYKENGIDIKQIRKNKMKYIN